MTTTVTPPNRPASIRLGELAIAASTAGVALTLVYRYFPMDVLSELWRYHAQRVGMEFVAQVHRAWDLKRLCTGSTAPRLILVTDASQRATVAWRVNLDRKQDGRLQPCPAIFSCHAGRDPDDEPGAALVIYGHPAEVRDVMVFLQETQALPKARDQLSTLAGLTFLPAVQCLLERGPQRYRDRAVVRSLLVGASVEQARTPSLVVSLDHYPEVYALLQRATVRSAEEPFDPLAAVMVARANVYLRALHHVGSSDRAARLDPADKQDKAVPLGITRRELTDLGNPRSRLVRLAIAFLLEQPNGYQQFGKLGLTTKLASGTGATWPVRDEAATESARQTSITGS
jgi:hypothetical protein